MNKIDINDGISKQENALFRIYNNQGYTKQLEKIFQASSVVRNKGTPKKRFENIHVRKKSSNAELLDKIVSETFHMYQAYKGDFVNRSVYFSEKKKEKEELDLSFFLKPKPGGFFRDYSPNTNKYSETSADNNRKKFNQTMIALAKNDSGIESNDLDAENFIKSNKIQKEKKIIRKNIYNDKKNLLGSAISEKKTTDNTQGDENSINDIKKDSNKFPNQPNDSLSNRLKYTYRLDKEKILSRIEPLVLAHRHQSRLPSLGQDQIFHTIDVKPRSRDITPSRNKDQLFSSKQKRSKSLASEGLPAISPVFKKTTNDSKLEIIQEVNRIHERKLRAEESKLKSYNKEIFSHE